MPNQKMMSLTIAVSIVCPVFLVGWTLPSSASSTFNLGVAELAKSSESSPKMPKISTTSATANPHFKRRRSTSQTIASPMNAWALPQEQSIGNGTQDGESNAQENLARSEDDFLTLNRQIRALDEQINQMFISMPAGFPQLQQQVLAEIAELKVRQTDLRERLDAAAIQSFKQDPERNYLAANHIGQLLVANLEGKALGRPYNPQLAAELVELLLDKAGPNGQLYSLAYSVAFAMEDFEKAEALLQQAVDLGQPISPELRERLAEMKLAWEKEQQIREIETAANDLPRVLLKTPQGELLIELYENQAPQTVANFLTLVENGFYEGQSFFQVQPGVLARAGCPDNNGRGDAGYYVEQEISKDSRPFFAGTLGMYHDGDGKASSQFFITYAPRDDFKTLNQFIAFGRVIDGLEVVHHLERVESGPTPIPPPTNNQILAATVIRKRDHEYTFTKLPKELIGGFELNLESGSGLFDSGIRDVAPPIKD